MRKLLIALFICSTASAGERVTMIDNSESTSIKDVVRNVVRAFDNEDLDSYESCFKEASRTSIRKKAAYLFAYDDCHMELFDIHVIEDDGESASAAVKYGMGGSSVSFVILAEVNLVKEEGEWRIDRETVKSKGPAPRVSSTSSVVGGPIVPAGRAPIWDPMNPDPDKIPEEMHHLMGDVGIREGFGCVGGRCAVK